MRFFSGVFVFVLGVTLAGFYFYSSDDREDQLVRATQIATRPVAVPTQTSAPRMADGTSPITTSNSSAAQASAASKAPRLAPLPLMMREASTAAIETSAVSAPAVKPAPLPSLAPAPASPIGPNAEQAKVQLARDLQRELKRVGCYDGDVDGDWGPGSKRAMASFIERVNAALPIEQPDYILLTLVQGHKVQACGASCPSGQLMSEAGRCIPQGLVIAQAARRNETVDRSEKPGTSKPANDKALPEARVADAGSSLTPRWATTVKPAIPNLEPARAQKPVVASLEPPTQSPAPNVPRPNLELPGRMTLGGSAAVLSAPSPSSGGPVAGPVWAQPTTRSTDKTSVLPPLSDKAPFRLAAIDKGPDGSTEPSPDHTARAAPAPSATRDSTDAAPRIRAPRVERSAPLPPIIVYRAPKPQRNVQYFAPPSFVAKPSSTRWSRSFFANRDLNGR